MTNNDVNCDSRAAYGEKPEFMFKKMSMGAAAGMAEKHISSMTVCYGEQIKTRTLAKSQTWKILGDYDYGTYEGNKDGGRQASIMSM
jgi:hypothetical protein